MSEVQIDDKELQRLRLIEAHYDQVCKESTAAKKLQDEWYRKKDASLAAKKLYDEANAKLLELIAAGTDPQTRLPFEEHQKRTNPHATDAPVVEGWAAVPIEALNLPKGLTNKLKENGIKTMGLFEERRQAHGRSLDIAGIGAEKADRANTALDDWLAANRDRATFAGAEATAEVKDGIKGGKLLQAVDALGQTFPKDLILQVSEEMEDGRVVLMAGGDQVFSVTKAEVALVTAVERAATVEILSPIPGCDNESDKLLAGFIAKVQSWHDANPIVESGAGRAVALGNGEWKPASLALVEA